MYALISMGLALVLLAILLRVKVRLGRAMILSSVGLAVLLGVTPGEFWQAVAREWHSKPLSQTTGYLFATLSLLIVFVNVLGTAMKETGVSRRLVPAIQGLFRSRRFAMAAIPLIMGMLPTPGGIMLSAPMVRDLGDHIGVSRTRSAAINFWFRHQWETIWPLFPSIPLIQSMFGISAFRLIRYNIAIVAGGILGGVLFLLLSGIPRRTEKGTHSGRLSGHLGGFMHALWPIALVAGLYAGFDISPAIGILLAVFLFLFFHKVPLRRWGGIFKSGIELDFVLLVLGALLFKLTLQAGGSIESVVAFFSEIDMPPYILIFFLPAMVSFLTGVTMPTVAMTFPFLMPYIGSGAEAKVGLETLAFSGLICGVMTTPVHLCLALSASYFEARLIRIILKVLAPVAFIAGAGIVMAVFFG
jgi:integral membrane protein (TIGR00529 family)